MKKIKRILLLLLVFITVLIAVVPIFWNVLSSFKKPMDVISTTPVLFFVPTLNNYSDLFTARGSFLPYFNNSLIVSLASTILSLTVACLSGYSLARIRPRGYRMISIAMLALRMLPPVVIIVPLFIVFAAFGLLDTYIGLIIPYTALNIPLAVWMMRSFFITLPSGLEEAAMIDGAGRMRTLLQIILPLTAPGMATTAVFSFILAWNDFVIALPLTSSNAMTIPVIAGMARTEEGLHWAKIGVIICIMVIPIFIFTLSLQKYIVSGLAVGSVKE